MYGVHHAIFLAVRGPCYLQVSTIVEWKVRSLYATHSCGWYGVVEASGCDHRPIQCGVVSFVLTRHVNTRCSQPDWSRLWYIYDSLITERLRDVKVSGNNFNVINLHGRIPKSGGVPVDICARLPLDLKAASRESDWLSIH